MRILALDASENTLKLLVKSIYEAIPEAAVFSFNRPLSLINFAKEKTCDIAFLDIQLWGMSVLEVARTLKDIYPKINIIFVTVHKKHAQEIFELYPCRYILKPVTKDAILCEINNLKCIKI